MVQQNQLAKQHCARQALLAQQAAAAQALQTQQLNAQAGADRKHANERTNNAHLIASTHPHERYRGQVPQRANLNASAMVPAAAHEPSLQTIESMGRIAPIPYSRVTLPPDFNPNVLAYDASLGYPANFLMYHHSQVMQFYTYLRSLQQ